MNVSTKALAIAALLVVLVGACRGGCGGQRNSASGASPALVAGGGGGTAGDSVAPVPLAQRLCSALHDLPARRRAACCGAVALASVGAECVTRLSRALGDKSVTLVAAEVDACAVAQEQALAGCDWTGPLPPSVPAACDGIIHGTRGEGASCRSSLECVPPLGCRGAAKEGSGRCAPALTEGYCGLGVDALAAFTRQDSADRSHPECVGWCERRRCVPALLLGASCANAVACGRDRHCAAGRCVDGAVASLGEACTGGGCPRGTRCVQGRCVVPGVADARCTSDFECAGRCRAAADNGRDGGADRRCRRSCD